MLPHATQNATLGEECGGYIKEKCNRIQKSMFNVLMASNSQAHSKRVSAMIVFPKQGI